ncbi:Os06g0245800 [Oryza sativa Japonica Group]|uniref:alanine--tRNA ligase n=1 Tax=Oryza sativa subsp. japonica TaxID=39947 RepID=A0A0N7KLU9_ORYSJ|nr:hypothetical protein EE612_033067 [Oryza sativa]BAS97025.1 Os06g0245800 [Oryza sativa Japonica Group]
MEAAALLSPTATSRSPLPLLSTAPAAHRLHVLLPLSGRRRRLCLRSSPRPRGSLGCAGDCVVRSMGSSRERGVLVKTSSSSASVESATQEVGAASSGEWSGDAIRRRFLDFYAARGHKILPSSSLVPDDPTVFLTIAGMLQFKPIFLGKEPRRVPCATTSQKCIRTNDIENVGRTSRHQTFFEMLGNFSFGDYFKKEAITWAWELTTKEFGLPPERLWISVFQDDDEAFSIWHNEVGVPKERIKRLGEDDNFWTSGATGPCGPCSEIYYDFYPERGSSDALYAGFG